MCVNAVPTAGRARALWRGQELPDTVACTSLDDLSAEVYDRAALAGVGAIKDSGRRRPVKGRLHILWSIASIGRRLTPETTADLERHGGPPSDLNMARVRSRPTRSCG